ncbi:MAG: DUF211 domain-containing protein [Gammaproteobacteria bacterium]|nr:DUF211 domain-containing protein [Gammaproteobacteria bacterium]
MVKVKKILLDVLKPHEPGVLEFARTIAAQGDDYRVELTVAEMDDKTETLQLIIEGADIQLETIVSAINSMGGSLHSIDGVDVVNVKPE